MYCSMKEVGEKEQRRALAAALTDILWTAGEEQAATVSLVTSDRCFTPNLDYKLDSFTERVLYTSQYTLHIAFESNVCLLMFVSFYSHFTATTFHL